MALASLDNSGLSWEWVGTTTLGPDVAARLSEFSGIWLVPASPYANPPGAFASISLARRKPIPFLGTCGGFQHALIEFARNVLGLPHASHAETNPGGTLELIFPLRCSLVERIGRVHLGDGTRLRQIYGTETAEEGYHCSYGLNPEHAGLFEGGTPSGSMLRIAARDTEGEVRAVELADHPFFIATLFQPERRALSGVLHPLVRAFIEAAE